MRSFIIIFKKKKLSSIPLLCIKMKIKGNDLRYYIKYVKSKVLRTNAHRNIQDPGHNLGSATLKLWVD